MPIGGKLRPKYLSNTHVQNAYINTPFFVKATQVTHAHIFILFFKRRITQIRHACSFQSKKKKEAKLKWDMRMVTMRSLCIRGEQKTEIKPKPNRNRGKPNRKKSKPKKTETETEN